MSETVDLNDCVAFSKRIYLDNNASTPLDPRLILTVSSQLEHLTGNPSSIHFEGKQLRRLISHSRDAIATFLNVRPQEIIFTSSGTESMNMILRGLCSFLPAGHILTSSVEHACTLSTLKALEKTGWRVTYLSPGAWGAVTPEAVEEAIRPDTKLIVLMAVNNETGVKTAIDAIAESALRKKIFFVVDAVAMLGKESFKIPEGVTSMAFSGHKIHALQGTGFAFIRSHIKLLSQLTGGGQEFGRRSGTENLLGILCLGEAVSLLAEELGHAMQKMLHLRNRFEDTLRLHLPQIKINGEGPRVGNVSNLAFEGIDGESLLIALDRVGVAASHGSACASGALEPSNVLLNMGLPLERVHSSLRFSFSRLNTSQEVDSACSRIKEQVMALQGGPNR